MKHEVLGPTSHIHSERSDSTLKIQRFIPVLLSKIEFAGAEAKRQTCIQ